jgi:hypothetical protein
MGNCFSLLLRAWTRRTQMSKLLKLFAAAVLMFSMGTVYAATTDTLDVLVLVRYLSVEVDNADDPYDFGIVDLATQNVATSSVTVTNDGNAAEDFLLQITGSPANLSVEEAAASPDDPDEYQLYALFDSDGGLVAGDFGADDLILESATRDGDSFFQSGSADQTADDVASAAAVELWLMFYAPPSLSAAHPQQTITITVTAQAA